MKLKRIIAIFAIVAMMVTMLSGCGNPNDSKTTAAPDAGTTAGPDEKPSDEATTATPEFSYPMEGNPTVEIWGSVSATIQKTYETHEERPVYKQMMENTGINMKWRYASSEENSKAEFEFMIASGKYTDIFTIKGVDAQQYYNDGVIIELTDVIDQYMPNLKAYLEAHPDIDKAIQSEDGKYYYIPYIAEGVTSSYGTFIRQDWMDELNLPMPETIDEWHDTLVKVKEEKDVVPILTRFDELATMGAFFNAFCPDAIIAANYYAEDGKAVYIPATDGYKEFMKLMCQWYEEGLIYADTVTMTLADWRAKMANGEGFLSVGYTGSGFGNIYNTGVQANPDFLFSAVPTASLKKGEEPKYAGGSPRVNPTAGNQKVITTTCENVEAAARLMDYAFSEEGIMLLNYGIENVSYTMVDGVPTYTDLILKNPQGLAVNEAKAPYMDNFAGGWGIATTNNTRGYYSATPGAPESLTIYSSKGEVDHTICMLTYTAEETEEMNLYIADINKYMATCRGQFLLGVMDIDTQWEEYISNLEKFGLTRVLEIKQAALDRYLAR